MSTAMELLGLHHVTAVTAQATGNLRYYTDTLGLRLVKKTVNQDNVSAYHLFYGDRAGRPGSEVTFFDWAESPRHRSGAREIGQIGLRVPHADALKWWQSRVGGEVTTVAGRSTLAFTDPEGQRLALVAAGADPAAEAWAGGAVPAEVAIQGLGPITLVVDEAHATVDLLTTVMGFRRMGGEGQLQAFVTGPGGAGTEVHVVERPDLGQAEQGAGGVHHVAFRTPNAQEQLAWRDRLHAAGVPTSGVIDRYYFKSLYFREPNGILFEIATDGPGFTVDEHPAALGSRLSLPPFLEGRRAAIESGLRPLDPLPVRPVSVEQ